MRQPLLKLAFIIFILLSATAAQAINFYPLVTYQCNTRADRIDLTYSVLQGKAGKNFHFSDKNGTYSPWQMVDIKFTDGQRSITKRRTVTKRCTLSSGDYTVTIQPHVFAYGLSDHCDNTISATVTIHHASDEILQPTTFEDFCLGNMPIISKIRVVGKTGDVKMKSAPKYTFY